MPIQAQGDVTVHRLLDGAAPDDKDPAIESVTLVAGDTIEESEVPKYVLDRVNAGEVAELKVVSKKEAEEVAARIAATRAADGENVINASNADENANRA